jgi:hypothetical protein
MSRLFQTWSYGFVPPDIDLPFTPMGRGMEARWVGLMRGRPVAA